MRKARPSSWSPTTSRKRAASAASCACSTASWSPRSTPMLRNYLLTAYKVFMRRKLFTAVNLGCIVLTLVVLMVITALLDTAFWPSGVEGRSDRFLQVVTIRMQGQGERHHTSTSPLG